MLNFRNCKSSLPGGTIDKVYFDAKSTFSVGDPQIEEVLRQAHVDLRYELVQVLLKDSMDFEDADRELIRSAVLGSCCRRILITHGTDTMTTTAEYLREIPGKTIVLTSALLPARFRDNDAIFNIGFAVAAVQMATPGVWIAMNGRLYDPGKVRKDRDQNRFLEVDAPAS